MLASSPPAREHHSVPLRLDEPIATLMSRYRVLMDAADLTSVVAEVIGWIAVSAAIACLFMALLIRLADGRWLRADAVVVDDDAGATIRWFAEGSFHERRLGPGERAHVVNPDEETVYYKERDPDRLRLHEPPVGRRIILTIGLVMLGIAIIAGVLGFAVALLAG